MSPAGILVVDKPGGMTSHDVVARVRRVLGTRKVGHAGTLDPMATGVLVVGVGRATRLLGHLAMTDKAYLATIRLGATTVTDDVEGDVVALADPADVAAVTADEIRAGLARMIGSIEQRPSAVSAIKVGGRRAYDRVRSGEEVVLEPRRVEITRLDVLGMSREEAWIDVDVDVECSTGTYVRAIARDLGEQLGVGGHLTSLRRTRVGAFALADAVPIDRVDADSLTSMDAIAPECFPVWRLDAPDAVASVRHGRRIPWQGPAASVPVAVLGPDGELLALATDDAGLTRYVVVLAGT